MANQDENKALLSIGIYVGVGTILYFLLKSFRHVKWIEFILVLVAMVWGLGGIHASFSMAHDGIDTKDKATRYILIFIAVLSLLLYSYSGCSKGGTERYFESQ